MNNTLTCFKDTGLLKISNGILFAPGATSRYRIMPLANRLPFLDIKPVNYQPVTPTLTRSRASKRWLAILGGALSVVVAVSSLVAIFLASQDRMHHIDSQKKTMALARQLRHVEGDLKHARFEIQQLRRETVSQNVQLAEYQTGRLRPVAVVRVNVPQKLRMARI